MVLTVLRNPLYVVFFALVGAGAYITYQLNLWGPMIGMANAAFAQALEEGKKALRQFLESSDTGRQAMAMSSGESYEMSNMNRSKKNSSIDGPDDDDDI